MRRNTMLPLCVITGLLMAGMLWAQERESGAQAKSKAGTEAAATTTPASTNADANANADASAKTESEERVKAIQTKGDKVSVKARAAAESKLDATTKKIDEEVAKAGDEKVAARLAAEFGMTAEAMTAEKSELNASWGNLMIAHTLAANAKNPVTVAELTQMHADGTGWGTIAAGLGLKLGEVVSGVKAEGRVAQGFAKADGKAAVIHGEGAKAGLGANAGVHAGADHGKAGAGLDTKVGVKIGH